MWTYNVCKAPEPQGNGYEILERYKDRKTAYMRLFALMDSDKSGDRYFVERFSEKKSQK